MLAEALADAAAAVRRGARGLVLAREGWHAGVVGIVAARVAERFHRPAVLIGVDGGEGKGSGRSIEGFHLYDALAACAGHLVALRRPPPRRRRHRRRRGRRAVPRRLRGATPRRRSRRRTWSRAAASTAGSPRATSTPRAAEDLERLGPFGAGHPEPVFALRAQAARARTVGAGAAHLKLGFGRAATPSASRMGDRLELCQGPVEAAFTLGFDDWDGMRRLQLKLRDLRAAG